MNVAIVGAGMAGLSAGTELVHNGHSVTVFDKGLGPGGRMATRRTLTTAGEAQFDHGAQYFTVRDTDFAAQVKNWERSGHVARWPAAGEAAWVGTPAMNAPLKAMVAGLDVRWNARIEAVETASDRWVLRGESVGDSGYDALIVAIPAEQAADLLAPIDAALARLAADTKSAPCWTVMAAFADTVSSEANVLMADGGAIGWAARNSAKPGRTGPEAWVIQGTPEWSAEHIEDAPDEIVRALLNAFALRVGALPALLTATAHRWRYARSGSAGGAFRLDTARRLGLCGDWLLEPHVEAAWLSGYRLAKAMAA